MTEYSKELKEALDKLKKIREQEKASGVPPDTSWTDNLPSDELPKSKGETVATFIKKTESGN